MMCQIYACPRNEDVVVRCGAEKNLGVVRRHCRKGNKPTVIFQGWQGNQEIITINWEDGSFCVLPETREIWLLLVAIKAFRECQVCHRNTSWYLTREILG